jgi:putative transposase
LILPNHGLSIRSQCQALGIHRSSLFYCPRESYEDSCLMNRIDELHKLYPCYGYRRLQWCLEQDGHLINHKKVHRLMKLMNIKPLYPGPKTTIKDKENAVFPYLLKGLTINKPNQVWSVDITYIKLPVGMVYLFALIDWYSRYIVSYKLVNTMEASHGIGILQEAIDLFGVPEICNADQGSQFTGYEWINLLRLYNILISHDGVGRCIDNIFIERFWRTIKYEDIFIQSYQTLSDARLGIADFIKHYNENRPHQGLRNLRPSDVYFKG